MSALLEIAFYVLYIVLTGALVSAIAFIILYLRWVWKDLHDDRKRKEGEHHD